MYCTAYLFSVFIPVVSEKEMFSVQLNNDMCVSYQTGKADVKDIYFVSGCEGDEKSSVSAATRQQWPAGSRCLLWMLSSITIEPQLLQASVSGCCSFEREGTNSLIQDK